MNVDNQETTSNQETVSNSLSNSLNDDLEAKLSKHTSLTDKQKTAMRSIWAMNVPELKNFIDLLSEVFGVSAAAMVAPVATTLEEEVEPKKEVKEKILIKAISSKSNAVRALKAIFKDIYSQDISLSDLVGLVNPLSSPEGEAGVALEVTSGSSNEVLEDVHKRLKDAGVTVEKVPAH